MLSRQYRGSGEVRGMKRFKRQENLKNLIQALLLLGGAVAEEQQSPGYDPGPWTLLTHLPQPRPLCTCFTSLLFHLLPPLRREDRSNSPLAYPSRHLVNTSY